MASLGGLKVKEYVNTVHVKGFANDQIVESKSSARVAIVCPHEQRICLCKRICRQIRLSCNNIQCIEDCQIQVVSKTIQCYNCEKTITVKYIIYVLFRDCSGCLQEICQEGISTFYNIQGNVEIDDVSVCISNPPRVQVLSHLLQVRTIMTIEYERFIKKHCEKID